jgi:formate hydrogenlyase transcriptional activator
MACVLPTTQRKNRARSQQTASPRAAGKSADRLDGASKWRCSRIEMSMAHRHAGAPPATAPPAADAELRQRMQFEALLADVSTRLLEVTPDSADRDITEALRRLAEHLRMDRGVLSAVDAADGLLHATHTWAAPGAPLVPLGLGEPELPWTAVRMRRGEAIIFSRPTELPPEAAGDLAAVRGMGVQSAALLPLSAGGRLIGTVSFSTVSREVPWPGAIRRRLRLIGDMFASVLLRCDGELELRRALARVRVLSERLEAENAYLRESALEAGPRGDIVGESAALRAVLVRVEQVARTDASVLVLGETGVGKELVAKAIHARSARRDATFVKVNCAALPATLVESELFGHEKGAFTGATARTLGRFELADRGTIFLDEIGELPLDLQAKLLRVLQDGEMERLGSQVTRRVDVRVIAATNRPLHAAVAERAFRADLYYRLAVFPIEVPPLRERREDIPLLVWYFVAQLRATLGTAIDRIPPAVMDRLVAYDWPGNVRELRNVVERAMIISAGPTLRLDDAFAAPPPGAAAAPAAAPPAAHRTLAEVERAHIEAVLAACGGRIRGRGQAAEVLGLHPSTLYSRMQKLGIAR